jgi:hypothetical protein
MPPLNPSHLISRPASNPPPCNAPLPGSERRSLAPDPAHEGLAALSGVPVRGLRFGHERRKRHPRAEQEALGPPRRTDGRRTPRASEGGAGAGAYGTNVAATARMYKKNGGGKKTTTTPHRASHGEFCRHRHCDFCEQNSGGVAAFKF